MSFRVLQILVYTLCKMKIFFYHFFPFIHDMAVELQWIGETSGICLEV